MEQLAELRRKQEEDARAAADRETQLQKLSRQSVGDLLEQHQRCVLVHLAFVLATIFIVCF